MKPVIKVVEKKKGKDLSAFIHFPEKLYKGDKWWVPALVDDYYGTLLPERNPAYEFCETELFLALDDKGEIVGRVAAIVNNKAIDIFHEDSARFGWIDFIQDQDVCDALLGAVENWALARGLKKIKGPFGFTDMDKEGLLVEGFERLAPFTTIYNYPYYGEMIEKAGYSKAIDWSQRIITMPAEMPKMLKLADALGERAGVHSYKIKDKKDLKKEASNVFNHLYNECFAPLYEFTPFSEKQTEALVKSYIPIMDKDLISVVHDKDENVVAFAITVPSLSRAIQKGKGKLLPFGIFHILHALKHEDTLEALMIGVHPDYQGKGLQVLLFRDIYETALKRGIKRMIMNPQLETNTKVLRIFDAFEPEPYMIRRAYEKDIA